MPRMPARVFAYILAEDRDRLHRRRARRGTPGLTRRDLRRGPLPHPDPPRRQGTRPAGRGDLYRVVDGDVWGTIQAARLPVLDVIIESVQEAVDLLREGSAGRERVEETRDYFRFVQEDALGLDRRWREWREAHQ